MTNLSELLSDEEFNGFTLGMKSNIKALHALLNKNSSKNVTLPKELKDYTTQQVKKSGAVPWSDMIDTLDICNQNLLCKHLGVTNFLRILLA